MGIRNWFSRKDDNGDEERGSPLGPRIQGKPLEDQMDYVKEQKKRLHERIREIDMEMADFYHDPMEDIDPESWDEYERHMAEQYEEHQRYQSLSYPDQLEEDRKRAKRQLKSLDEREAGLRLNIEHRNRIQNLDVYADESSKKRLEAVGALRNRNAWAATSIAGVMIAFVTTRIVPAESSTDVITAFSVAVGVVALNALYHVILFIGHWRIEAAQQKCASLQWADEKAQAGAIRAQRIRGFLRRLPSVLVFIELGATGVGTWYILQILRDLH